MGAGFAVDAAAYDAYMGRYSALVSEPFADVVGVTPPQRVLDVGCGPGALTAVLVRRLGAASVSAVDPSATFVDAVRVRLPGVDARRARAEDLPFGDASFDACAAQLVVHFMDDPVGGVREMARVTRPGGVVAACVWDYGGGRGPVSEFWALAQEVDPGAPDESALAGVSRGDLGRLLRDAGLGDVAETEVTARARHTSFEDWWEPFTRGVGPAGQYVSHLTPAAREALREHCRQRLPREPEIPMAAWAARGTVPGGPASAGGGPGAESGVAGEGVA